MGWSLKIQETKKHGTKYKIWGSIGDKWITGDKWLTGDEIIKFLFWYKFRSFMQDFMEVSMTFPNGYSEKGEMRYLERDKEKDDEWHEFIRSTWKEEDGNELFHDKFFEILKEHDIKISLSDEKFNLNNIEDSE